jgi:hypothetical protein
VVNRIVTMVLVLLVLPVSVSAEIYKYRDQNGVLRFTDNLAEVPAPQRENIEQYQEIKTPAGAFEQTPAVNSEQTDVQDSKAVEKELTNEKEVLDNEYSRLMEMRNSLESAPQPGTPEENAAYEKRVQDYNNQLNIYEVKQKAFRTKVEEYRKDAAKN